MADRVRLRTALLIAGVLLVAPAQASPPDRASSLFQNAGPPASLPAQARAGSGVEGRLDASALDTKAIAIELADGRSLTARLQRIARDDRRGVTTWIGSFDDVPGSSLVLSRVRGTVSGFATLGDETLEIVPGESGHHILYAVDPEAAPSLDGFSTGGGDVPGTTDGAFTGGGGNVGPVVQDLLVVYTAASASAWSPATLEGMVQSAVQSANQAYANSQVGIDLEVVGLQQVPVDESGGGMPTTLDRLKASAEVRSLRDALGADMVVLVSEETDWCGYASLAVTTATTTTTSGTTTTTNAEAWAVASSRCLSNNTLAHEVGHLQGLDHDRDDSTGGGLYPYAYGYRRCASGGFRDIMSYPCTTTGDVPRILQFSNPSLYYNGYATGVSYEIDPAHAADASRALNASAALVASFRDPPASSSLPAAPVSPTGLVAATLAYDRVGLAWTDNSTDESGFSLERSADGVAYQAIASLGADATAFTDVSVDPATRYYYRVRGWNGAGASGWSVASATTPSPPPPPPAAPSNVAALDGGNGTASVSWSAVAGATSFDVRRETWNARKKRWERATIVASVDSAMLAITDGSGAGTFRYAVRAINAGGASAWASAIQVTVTATGSGTVTKARRR
jgi:hypothetical protein